jgi:ankyrin repeat protein
MAVLAGQLESIKLLLAAGVSVEDKNCGVFSPLTTAIREGRKDIVRYLLDVAGADPNAPGEHLPMVKALRKYKGDKEIIQMLLARGASINAMHRYFTAQFTFHMNYANFTSEAGTPSSKPSKTATPRSSSS